MKRIVGIYKITSPSGKVYIGQSWNILHRWADYGKKTAKSQRMLCFSFNKYGKKAHRFEIINELPSDVTQQILDRYEESYISFYQHAGFVLLNSRLGGNGGKLSEETRRRVSESLKGRTPWNKGLKGIYKATEETKNKMSESMKAIAQKWNIGRKMPDHVRAAIRKANVGRIKTEEERTKLSNSLKGKPYHGKNNGKIRSESVRKLHSEIQKARTDNKGEGHHLSKLSTEAVLSIRSKFKPYVYTIGMLCKEYSLSRTHVKDIIRKKSWKHI